MKLCKVQSDIVATMSFTKRELLILSDALYQFADKFSDKDGECARNMHQTLELVMSDYKIT